MSLIEAPPNGAASCHKIVAHPQNRSAWCFYYELQSIFIMPQGVNKLRWIKSISSIRNSQQMHSVFGLVELCVEIYEHILRLCSHFLFLVNLFFGMFQMITRISSNLQHLPQVSPDLYCLQMSLVIATLKMISTTRHHQRILHQQAMIPYQEEETWWNLR